MGSIIGSAITGATSLAATASQVAMNERNISSQERMNRENIAHQRETNAAQIQLAKEVNQSNVDLTKQSWREQELLQRQQNDFNVQMWNMNNEYNSPQAQVNRLMQAGLNPNMALPNTGNAAAAPVQSSLPSTPAAQMQQPNGLTAPRGEAPIGDTSIFANLATGFNQAMLNYQQARRLKIENDRLEDEDNEYRRSKHVMFMDSDGNPINDIKKWETEHPNEIPDTVVLPPMKSRGSFDARYQLNEFRQRMSDVDASIVRNKLETLVNSMQSESKDSVNALVHMPDAQFKKLCSDSAQILANVKKIKQDTKNAKTTGLILDLDKQAKELELKIRKETNLMQYVDKIMDSDKDFSLKDACKLFLLFMVNTQYTK